MRRSVRALGWFAAGGAAMVALWAGGLVWFVLSSMAIPADPATRTDAIVVLTGGRLRLETGLDLLGADRAQRLFISGVNPHVDRIELMRVAGHGDDNDRDRIDLGHDAGNTLGNARETAGWMRQQGYRSLRLVTSWYHMRRSLLEFERAMPETLIVAEPVFSGREGETSSESLDVALLTVSEYDKFLATLLLPEIAVIWPRAGEPHSEAAESAVVTSHHP